jgi:formylglycine-generating enzyme required for sulfatase activity
MNKTGTLYLSLIMLCVAMIACTCSTPSVVPTERPTQAATQTPTVTPEPTLAGPSLGDTQTRPADGMVMVYVPAGEFRMGSTDQEVDEALRACNELSGDCRRGWFENEQPAHGVVVDSFWIDQTEVTNRQYQQCVEAGACDPPPKNPSKGSFADPHYDDDAYTNHPVIYMNPQLAGAYCEWAGGRLPTEAEWEYAARGPEAFIYPWGNVFDGTRLNYCDVNCKGPRMDSEHDDGYAGTSPVGSYPNGTSWCGAFDMAGNAEELVGDWYGPYSTEVAVNPQGPSSGHDHVVRGGMYTDPQVSVRSSYRRTSQAGTTSYSIGFRCVLPAPTETPTPAGTPVPTPRDELMPTPLALGEVNAVAFSPGGETLAVGTATGVSLYSSNLSEQIWSHTSDALVFSVAWSPDGKTLASGTSDDAVTLWNVQTGEIIQIFEGDTDWLRSIAWSPDGGTIAVGSGASVVLWNAATGEPLQTLGEDLSILTYSVAWSPDGSTIASGDAYGRVLLWDAHTGERLNILTLHDHTAEINSLAWSPDGSVLASGGGLLDGDVILWDTTAGKRLRTLHAYDVASVGGVAWSPDGLTIAVAAAEPSANKLIILWDAGTGKRLNTLEVHTAGINSLAWSPDGTTLASGSSDGTVVLSQIGE